MNVAFTPAEAAAAPVAIVVDVLRAPSTTAQAPGSGYRRVLPCGEIEEACALREEVGEGLRGGERAGIRIEEFDVVVPRFTRMVGSAAEILA